MMSDLRTVSDTEIALVRPEFKRFIDPYSDFGFKHIFGRVPNRNLLIKFLNGVFKGRKVIVDIKYNNIEYKGPGKDYRKTVFDLYCTGDDGGKFIIEMQKAKVDNFKDRSIFYTSNLIQELGIGVVSDWDYLLPEIYFLAIMNFKFDNSRPDHFIHDVRLVDVNTNEQFYDKIGYIFIEMPKFKKSEGHLENELEEWLYLLNNLENLEEIPVSLKGKEEYEQVLKIAELGSLTPEEMNEYQQSLKIERDYMNAMKSALNTAKSEGVAEGMTQGMAKGKAEGKHSKALEIALKLINKGFSTAEVAESTDLSIEEIEALR